MRSERGGFVLKMVVPVQRDRMTEVLYYAEVVEFRGVAWRTWRLSGLPAEDHPGDAILSLVGSVHALEVRVT